MLIAAQRAVRERHPQFDLTLGDIAKDVGCSTRQLQRLFMELSGESFRNYLLRIRMERAQRLLARKKLGLTVRAAARAVGYREASGLRQALLRYCGKNPSEFQPPPPDYDELWRQVELGGVG
jgi:two-component system response regulator YesN